MVLALLRYGITELLANDKAREFFDSLAPSYKRQYIGWVSSGKREETRRKRVTEAIGLLEQNKKTRYEVKRIGAGRNLSMAVQT